MQTVTVIILLAVVAVLIGLWMRKARPEKPGQHGRGLDDEIATAVEDVIEDIMEDPDRRKQADRTRPTTRKG